MVSPSLDFLTSQIVLYSPGWPETPYMAQACLKVLTISFLVYQNKTIFKTGSPAQTEIGFRATLGNVLSKIQSLNTEGVVSKQYLWRL